MKSILILASLFFASCGSPSPKFKVGDCAISKYESWNEFKPNTVQIDRILKVGKRNYLYGFGYFYDLSNELSIEKYDSIMVKVDCPKGEK